MSLPKVLPNPKEYSIPSSILLKEPLSCIKSSLEKNENQPCLDSPSNYKLWQEINLYPQKSLKLNSQHFFKPPNLRQGLANSDYLNLIGSNDIECSPHFPSFQRFIQQWVKNIEIRLDQGWYRCFVVWIYLIIVLTIFWDWFIYVLPLSIIQSNWIGSF